MRRNSRVPSKTEIGKFCPLHTARQLIEMTGGVQIEKEVHDYAGESRQKIP